MIKGHRRYSDLWWFEKLYLYLKVFYTKYDINKHIYYDFTTFNYPLIECAEKVIFIHSRSIHIGPPEVEWSVYRNIVSLDYEWEIDAKHAKKLISRLTILTTKDKEYLKLSCY